MAYIKNKEATAGTAEPQTTQLSGGQGGVLGAQSGGGGGSATGTAAATRAAGRTQTTPNYVSGQQYLEGNRAGAQKLATQIVDPLKSQASAIEDTARTRALGAIQEAGANDFNQGLVDKAAADARTLSDIERTNVQQTLSGIYGGPQDVDFSAERQDVNRLGESTAALGTAAGVNQALTGLSGGRKYTSGMRDFDAMLMRQDPSLRQKLEQQAGLGDRVTGTIDAQRAQALAAIAEGKTLAGDRGTAATNQLAGVATGQEGMWTDELGRLRTAAGGIADRVTNEQTLTQQQLDLIGLDAGAYDQMRDAYVASSYGMNRPMTYPERYNYNIMSPTQFTAPDAYVANAWKNFQLDPYAQGLNVNDIGYNNVVDQESLAKYQALNELRGAANVGWAPQSAGTGNLTENALNFNGIAAQAALQNFMKSGVAAPRSNLDVAEGYWGPGGNWNSSTNPEYTKTGADYQQTDPLTGQKTTAFKYTGPMSGGVWSYPTQSENLANYTYDRSVDQAMLDERNARSGG